MYVTACSVLTPNCNKCSSRPSGEVCEGCSDVIADEQGRFLVTIYPTYVLCKGKKKQFKFLYDNI